MNTDQLFQELGINPLIATKLMGYLDLNTGDLNDPFNFSKIQDVVDFLKQYPEDDQRFMIRKVTIGKQDKLKVMHEYTQILKDKAFHENTIAKIREEKRNMAFQEGGPDLEKVKSLDEQEVYSKSKLNQVKEELEFYHK